MSLIAISANSWLAAAGIIPATLVSEDLTCITTGLLIREHGLSPLIGVLACFLGIYIGDLGLWLTGHLIGGKMLRWSWLAGRLPAYRLEQLGQWFDRRGWSVICASRFLPGTRLPLYVAAGMLGRKAGRFAWWTMLAAAIWTPLLVLGVALVGREVLRPLQAMIGFAPAAIAATALLLLLLIRFAVGMCTSAGRERWVVRLIRLRSYEFWPAWLFYLPLLPYLAYLTVRYRGLSTLTAANPGIPDGGVVGESKSAILSQLPREWIVPSVLIAPGDVRARCRGLDEHLARRGWDFPLVFKPDAAQRGAGVRKVRDAADAAAYLAEQPGAVLVQTYDPGPFEAGIFYYRIPGAPTGRIFSITDKVFPTLIGDGESTLETLIRRHPRYRLQASVFVARHGRQLERVLAAGERFALALAGNHCQGTMFRDGAHLYTPELEQAVDAIARTFEGFFIGRFDVRYGEVEAFKAGRDLRIVELNGVTSESTNLYDPAWSVWRAYRTLFRQWKLIFEIGHRNRCAGHRTTRLAELARSVRSYYRDCQVTLLAD